MCETTKILKTFSVVVLIIILNRLTLKPKKKKTLATQMYLTVSQLCHV